jgi:hypothetical protein
MVQRTNHHRLFREKLLSVPSTGVERALSHIIPVSACLLKILYDFKRALSHYAWAGTYIQTSVQGAWAEASKTTGADSTMGSHRLLGLMTSGPIYLG